MLQAVASWGGVPEGAWADKSCCERDLPAAEPSSDLGQAALPQSQVSSSSSVKGGGIYLLLRRKRAIWIKYYLEARPHPHRCCQRIFAEYVHCHYLLFVLGRVVQLCSSARFHRTVRKRCGTARAVAVARLLQLPATGVSENQRDLYSPSC